MKKLAIKTFSLKKVLIAGALLMSAGLATVVANTSPMPTLGEIAVAGKVSPEQRSALFEVIKQERLFELPMPKIKRRLEEVDWVYQATLARRWPDTLEVTIEPEIPIALWNDDAYLNEQGQVFRSPFLNQSRLPQLYGPDGQQEVVMAQYLELNSTLFKGGQHIEQLTLDSRGNWQFKSNLDIEVLLGKAALMERMQRLLTVINHLGPERSVAEIKQIDTRYVNGVAVAWHDQSLIANTVSTEIKLATNYNSQREP